MEKSLSIKSTQIINDIEMYYEICGEGKPLVLLHGWGGIGANWKLIFEQPPKDYQLIIPDLRGHGRSTNPSKQFSFRQCALDIFALLDSLSVKEFQVIGMSLGAKTLLHMAAQQPNRISSMVLVSATPYFPQQARDIMGAMALEKKTKEEWEQMRQWHQQGDEQIIALWQQALAFKDSYDDMNFTPPYLSTIRAKTLIVHGDKDPLYPVNLAMELYQAIPKSYLWIIPNAGHVPIFGAMTDNFAKTSLAFLQDKWQS